MTDKPVPERNPIEEADIQLFHLDVDPNEENDLARQLPQEAADMEKRLMNWYVSVEKERISE